MGRHLGKRVFAFAGAIAITGLVAACAPEAAPEPPPPAPATPVAVTTPPPPLPAAPVGATASPLDPTDAPDPSVISVDRQYCIDEDAPPDPLPTSCYFAYTTQVLYVPVMVWRSTDLVEWEWMGGAMPAIAPWTHYGHHWAPSVFERPNNPPEARFVMWYTARDETSGMQCLGFAVSASPLGPFADSRTAPAYCQYEFQGTIDPSQFVDDDGTAYLLFRSEVPAKLFSAKLSADGRSIINGTETVLWTGSAPDASVVEAPTMVHVDGKYTLFYSTDSWDSAAYRVGVARCTSAVGPCTRVYSTALLASRGAMVGPGGQTPFQDVSGNWHLLFHAWTAPKVGYPQGGARTLRLLPLTFDGDTIRVG